MEDPSQQGKRRPAPAAHLDRLDSAKAYAKEGAAEPVLRSTDDMSAYLVAAQAVGQGVNAILEDHPDLTREQV